MIPDCICTRNGIPSQPKKFWDEGLADEAWECSQCGHAISDWRLVGLLTLTTERKQP